jgi:hypothetical protein
MIADFQLAGIGDISLMMKIVGDISIMEKI